MAKHFEALAVAYAILDQAARQCAGLPCNLPFKFLSDARSYIATQADEIVRPIFEEVDLG